MKIQSLHLKNFSSHADSNLEFKTPLALVVGQLNAGKSSILQAIEYALTGACGLHRKKNDNKSELVRGAGAFGQMAVGVQTSIGMAKRVRDPKENTEAMEWAGMPQSSGATMDAVVAAATRVPKTVLSALLNTSDFFNLEDAEQRSIILGLIGAEVTDIKVRQAWEGEAPALALLPSKINSMKELDAAYDYCFKRRTVAKRELGELKPPAPPEGDEPPLQRMKDKLAVYEKNLEGFVREKARIEGAAQAVSGKDRLIEERKRLDTELALPKPDARPLAEQLKAKEEERTEAGKALLLLENEIVDIRVRVSTAKLNIDLLTDFKGVCVAGSHACPAPMKDMMAAKQDQQALHFAAEKELVAADQRRDNIRQITNNRGPIVELENKIRDCQRELAEREKKELRLKAIDAELKKPDAVNTDSTEIPKLEASIASTRESISKGKTLIENAASWQERKRAVAEVAERRKAYETEVRYLEGLCDFLGPKGVRVKLIDEKIGTFMDTIATHLKPFGFTMDLKVEDWQVFINSQPVKRLSASERYRLSVAFQVGIAKMSGLNFVICDGSEILTPPVFSQMMGMLAGAGLDQAVIIKTLMITTEKFIAERPKMPALEYFVVTNDAGVSKVERLG